MAELPIRPHFKRRGRTSRTVQKADAFNKMAQRIGDYLHTLILEDRARVQHYSYAEIGRALGLEPQEVEAAIGDGNYTGVTFFVDAAHRNVIASQLKPAADGVVLPAAARAFANAQSRQRKSSVATVRAATDGGAPLGPNHEHALVGG
jgi:hypothetical protein